MAPPLPQTSERRLAERMTLRCPVTIEVPGFGLLRGQCVDISAHGMLVKLPRDVLLGVEMKLEAELPDGKPALELRVIAVHQERGLNGAPPVRIGLYFMLPPREALARIRCLIYGD